MVSRSSWRRRARRDREPVQVRAHVGNDQLGEVHDADTGPGRGRPERVTGPVVVELASALTVRASRSIDGHSPLRSRGTEIGRDA